MKKLLLALILVSISVLGVEVRRSSNISSTPTMQPVWFVQQSKMDLFVKLPAHSGLTTAHIYTITATTNTLTLESFLPTNLLGSLVSTNPFTVHYAISAADMAMPASKYLFEGRASIGGTSETLFYTDLDLQPSLGPVPTFNGPYIGPSGTVYVVGRGWVPFSEVAGVPTLAEILAEGGDLSLGGTTNLPVGVAAIPVYSNSTYVGSFKALDFLGNWFINQNGHELEFRLPSFSGSGTTGLVFAASTNSGQFLRGDGIWADLPTTTNTNALEATIHVQEYPSSGGSSIAGTGNRQVFRYNRAGGGSLNATINSVGAIQHVTLRQPGIAKTQAANLTGFGSVQLGTAYGLSFNSTVSGDNSIGIFYVAYPLPDGTTQELSGRGSLAIGPVVLTNDNSLAVYGLIRTLAQFEGSGSGITDLNAAEISNLVEQVSLNFILASTYISGRTNVVKSLSNTLPASYLEAADSWDIRANPSANTTNIFLKLPSGNFVRLTVEPVW